jgi:hypothetical protein
MPQEDMKIISADIAGSVIREGSGKLATVPKYLRASSVDHGEGTLTG